MGTHNICLYKEVDKKYTGCNLKAAELLDCALIGACAIIRSNTLHVHCLLRPLSIWCCIMLPLMTILYFTSLSTIFKSYPEARRLIMKASVQWSTEQSRVESYFQWYSNSRPCDPKSVMLTTLLTTRPHRCFIMQFKRTGYTWRIFHYRIYLKYWDTWSS